jgi:hypothetical protein
MKFEDLQSQWQANQAPDTGPSELTHDSIMARIIRLQRKTIFAGLGVSVSFAFVFIAIGLLWQKTAPHAWYYHVGIVLIYLDMVLALIFIWSLVISYKNRQLSLSSYEFVSRAILKLKRRQLISRTVIPIYLLILVLGINLIYLESLTELSNQERILTHLLVSVLTVGGGMAAVVWGRKRERDVVRPLLEELLVIKQGLEPEGD